MKDISINLIKKFLHGVLVSFLCAMFCLVFVNVFLRYIFSSSITWCDEASRYLFIWIIFIGGLIAYQENTHLGVEVIVTRLSERGKKILFIFNNAVVLIVLCLIIVGCWKYFQVTMEQRSPSMDIPLVFVYASAFVSAIGMVFVTVDNLYLLLTNKMSGNLLSVTGSEEQIKIDEVLSDSAEHRR